MTGQDILNDVRLAINDATSVGWTDAQLAAFLNSSLVELRSDLPESYMTAAGAIAAHVALTVGGLGNTLIVPDNYRGWLVESTASRALMRDSGDKQHETRGARHEARAVRSVRQVPGD